MDWFSPIDVADSRPVKAPTETLRARSLEEWVWQTLESVAGGAHAKSQDVEEEAPQPTDQDEHLVSMVTSITISSS